MRTVGDCTEKAKEILSNHGCKVFFEWNQGGHGKGVTKRWQRAVRRLLTMMAKRWKSKTECGCFEPYT